MGQKSEVYSQVIKKVGHWNFRDLYAFLYSNLTDRSYKISEKRYEEKNSGAGKELIIEWVAKKKVSDYFRFIITVKWHILTMSDAEVEKNGKIVKTNKGEVKLAIKAELEKDYEERWEDRPIWKFLRGIYDQYIIRTSIDEYEGRAQKEVKEFIEESKAFLQV